MPQAAVLELIWQDRLSEPTQARVFNRYLLLPGSRLRLGKLLYFELNALM